MLMVRLDCDIDYESHYLSLTTSGTHFWLEVSVFLERWGRRSVFGGFGKCVAVDEGLFWSRSLSIPPR